MPIRSIKTFLLVNILLGVTIVISLAIIGNILLEHKDIYKQRDLQLHQASKRINNYIKNIQDENLHNKTVTKKIKSILATSIYVDFPTEEKKYIQKYINYQIWSKDGQLILSLDNTNTTIDPLAKATPGFSNVWHNNKSTRINTSIDPSTKRVLMISEHNGARQQLENKLTQDSIIIMLTTLPFLSLLVWIIIGRALAPISRITHEVSHRAPSHLSPVSLDTIPIEIMPLIQELNSFFDRLSEAMEREKRFASDAAHELRTPLAVLSAQTQVALCAKTENERTQALAKIVSGVKRSGHIVHQLLTLSRMVPEATIQQPKQINLNQLAIHMISEITPQALTKDIELELHATEQVTISGNPISIEILLRNLIDNALRYSSSNSQVIVTIENRIHEKAAALIVRDTGPGIPEELRARVFERFYRVVGNKASGSGLGLGIVKQIVKLHCGDIELRTPNDPPGDPKQNKGLEIYILFPQIKTHTRKS